MDTQLYGRQRRAEAEPRMKHGSEFRLIRRKRAQQTIVSQDQAAEGVPVPLLYSGFAVRSNHGWPWVVQNLEAPGWNQRRGTGTSRRYSLSPHKVRFRRMNQNSGHFCLLSD
jgi:hypothetical protein